jgi:hypothetical protein
LIKSDRPLHSLVDDWRRHIAGRKGKPLGKVLSSMAMNERVEWIGRDRND